MDELELLKKDWQKDSADFPKLSAKEIYPMLLKKSSSFVKWIFYISIAELVFWVLLNSVPFLFESYQEKFEAMSMSQSLFYGLTIFSYIVILIFVFLLYKSYKSISVVDSAKGLMERILHTRKIIQYYVLYNLVLAFVSFVISLYYEIKDNPLLSEKFAEAGNGEMALIIVKIAVILAVVITLIWLFYRLLYGILLKRLNNNYQELKKLED